MSRRRFLDAITAGGKPCPTAYGSGTSIVCRELMEKTEAWFPEAHLDGEKMAALALAGHTVLGFRCRHAVVLGVPRGGGYGLQRQVGRARRHARKRQAHLP